MTLFMPEGEAFCSREDLPMPPQDDASLMMINANNTGFGTVRLDPQADEGNYLNHLALTPQQMPSVYYGSPINNNTLRLRPLHEHGFVGTTAGTRLYFAVAGLLDEMHDPRNALSTSWEAVTDPIYKSKYYVYVRLGVSGANFAQTLAALQNTADLMSTDELVNANAASNVTGPTRVVYVTGGDLAGTFWAFKRSGWKSDIFGRSDLNKRYRPLCLMDFPIGGAQVGAAQATGPNFGNALALIPDDRANVHVGHSLIDANNLRAYYQAQVYPSPAGNVDGDTIWTNFNRLGSFIQRASYPGLHGVAVTGPVIRAGSQYYPRDYFRSFPAYDRNLPSTQVTANQAGTIAAMINGFVGA
ncbi:hypothetical protein [Pannonibacter phragmitetus]|uniref:hypothetical protein n=1 Tax=Pannonibacter phragmitetus TaxID=121719 RepID=UPI003D2EFFFF